MSGPRRCQLAAVLLALAALGLAELLLSNRPRLRPSEVTRIQAGMTRAEAEAALGQPPAAEGPPSQFFGVPVEGATWVAVWECRGGWILVFFAADRVVRATVGHRIPLWDRWRQRLR